MKTGLLIKELRIKKGLTQEELAGQTELSTRTIQRIENGDVDPRAYSLQMIAKALDVDYSIIIKTELQKDLKKPVKNDQLFLALIHLSGLLLIFIPTILIWNKQKNKIDGINDHFNDVISFQLTIWLFSVLPGIALHFFFTYNSFVNKAPYMILLGVLFAFVFSIGNAVKVINKQPYARFNFFRSKNKRQN